MGDCKREFHISGNYIESQVINNTFYDQSQYVSNDAVVESTSATDKDQVANASAPCQAGKAVSRLKQMLAEADNNMDAERQRKLMTFSLNGVLDGNISLFYALLVQYGWISPVTAEYDFKRLFSGRPSNCRIVWTGKYGKSTLVFLFRYLEKAGIISQCTVPSLPNILMGHFIDSSGNYLTNLDKGNAPSDRAQTEINSFMDVLTARPTGQDRYDDLYSAGAYDGSVNRYDLESDGLTVRNPRGFGK